MPNQDSQEPGQIELVSEIAGRRQRAVLNELGGSLRSLSVDGIDLVQDYPAAIPTPMSAGAVLVPWPNRIAGGAWRVDGIRQQLPITEPARGHAIHGLLRSTRYTVAERSETRVVLAADVHAQDGYPFGLSTTVAYELNRDGLEITHMIENTGDAKAPVAVGNHPYLKLGNVPVGELKLVINAESHMELDELMIPTGRLNDVAATAFDYRQGRTLGHVQLDDLWTGLNRDADGGSTHWLEAPDGSRVELSMDAAFGYIQVYTTEKFPTEAGELAAVAVEPMTAPANAFNNGLGLHWIEPGERWNIGWGIRHSPEQSRPAMRAEREI